jgi:hypothetical protein
MDNPWNEITLSDYESHMSLASVLQLQTMNAEMQAQINGYSADTIMILGIAGGNGLEHIEAGKHSKVFGVDVNGNYLDSCVKRYPELKGVFIPVQTDLTKPDTQLPRADLVIANLLIEYIGYAAFQHVLDIVKPQYVSCMIQINKDSGFVSDSPYLQVFDCLNAVHHQLSEKELTNALRHKGYIQNYDIEKPLPNGKALLRLDYTKT